MVVYNFNNNNKNQCSFNNVVHCIDRLAVFLNMDYLSKTLQNPYYLSHLPEKKKFLFDFFDHLFGNSRGFTTEAIRSSSTHRAD